MSSRSTCVQPTWWCITCAGNLQCTCRYSTCPIKLIYTYLYMYDCMIIATLCAITYCDIELTNEWIMRQCQHGMCTMASRYSVFQACLSLYTYAYTCACTLANTRTVLHPILHVSPLASPPLPSPHLFSSPLHSSPPFHFALSPSFVLLTL